MARLRTLKPGFFKNELLAEVEPLGRLLFEGLWTVADRSGRLEDRPKRIKAEVLPYDDADVDHLLNQLTERGFIARYHVDGQDYIQIVTFEKHQNPHHREPESVIPAPESSGFAPESSVRAVPFSVLRSPFSTIGLLSSVAAAPQPSDCPSDFEGPPIPANLDGWLDALKTEKGQRNPVAVVAFAAHVLGGGEPTLSSVPKQSYGSVGKLCKRANDDYGYVLKVLWDAASARPAGNLLSYAAGILSKKTGSAPARDPPRTFHERRIAAEKLIPLRKVEQV